jgi:cob(I)alamin adenosyltransferase
MSSLKLSFIASFVHEINTVITPLIIYLKLEQPQQPFVKELENAQKQLFTVLSEVRDTSQDKDTEAIYQQSLTELKQVARKLHAVATKLTTEMSTPPVSDNVQLAANNLSEVLNNALLLEE